VRDASSRGNPSKRFWDYFFAFWIVLAVVALIGQSWWNVATAAFGILFTAMQWRNAPDKPRQGIPVITLGDPFVGGAAG
jgi:Flp pilus assembly protein TadB